jgi:hypothetical protein
MKKERAMKVIPAHARVRCTDGDAGTASVLFVDPEKKRLTDVVVRERGVEDIERVVPLGLVGGTSEDTIELGCTRNELHGLDGFFEAHFADATYSLANGDSPHTLSDPWPLTVSKKVRQGKVTLGRHSILEAGNDGPIGRLESVIVGDDGRITYVVVRTRRFLSREEVAVPITDADEFFPNYIDIHLSRAAIERLPHVPMHEGTLLSVLGLVDDGLVPEGPEDAGAGKPEVDISHLEGAHLLAEEIRGRLKARGFTDEQILDWAKAFLRDQHSGGEAEFLAWIETQEHAGSPQLTNALEPSGSMPRAN